MLLLNYLKQLQAFRDYQTFQTELSSGQIALYYALLQINNKCSWIEWFTAANRMLETLSGLSRSGINKNRNVLRQLGLIDFRSNGKKATSYKVCVLYTSDSTQGSVQDGTQRSTQNSVQGSTQESVQQSSTLIKHKQKHKQNNKEIKKEPKPDPIPYKKIIDYLNDKTESKFRDAESNKKFIKARWHEGYRLNDFWKVIDNKTAEWSYSNKMSKFLRPRTLFGTKFDDYLNQPKQSYSGNHVQNMEQATDWGQHETEDLDPEKIKQLNERLKKMHEGTP